MGTFQKAVKISSKGQITLPKAIRKLLHTDQVRIVAEGGVVKIEPIRDVAGKLSLYARNYVPFDEAREEAWREALREKHGRD